MTTRPADSPAHPFAPRVRCPDCREGMGRLDSSCACPKCGRAFARERSVWDFVPRALHPVKVNEDLVHIDGGLPTWRRLLSHKRHWIEWAETRFLPSVLTSSTRRFLEIGGGLCYASALAKALAPEAFVVGSDVSARYLRNHALRTGEIIGTPADAYAAVDAEELPFEDGQFDAVYSQVLLYRLPDPARALREIRRVLSPGGRYLGVERLRQEVPHVIVRSEHSPALPTDDTLLQRTDARETVRAAEAWRATGTHRPRAGRPSAPGAR